MDPLLERDNHCLHAPFRKEIVQRAVTGQDVRHHAFDADRYRLSASMTNKERYEIAGEQSAKKLILGCTPEFREELYDLETDPGERSDLILDKPQLAGRLSDAMADITLSDPCKIIIDASQGQLPEDLLSPEQIEQLRSLGYIQ